MIDELGGVDKLSELFKNIEAQENAEDQEDYLQVFRDRITGTKVSYYFVCKRKLWLFSHNITFEQESEDVKIGKQINMESYSGFKKDIFIDQKISFDFIRNDGQLVVHEIKKSRMLENSHKWQLLYYLYYLKKKGIFAVGELNYPNEKKKLEVILRKDDEDKLENVIDEIGKIVVATIPEVINSSICKKCAYFEFCYGDEP